jgi:hypothetical protein
MQALRITGIQIRLGIADVLLHLALSIAYPHWSIRTVESFRDLIDSIKMDLDDH